MIVVHKRNDLNEFEPVLVYDAEAEEMWGLPRIWESNLGYVGFTEEEFAEYFRPPNWSVERTDEDPFADVPNAEDFVRNYPPGSEEIPEAARQFGDNGNEDEEGNENTAEKAAEDALSALTSSAGTLTKSEYEAVDDALFRAHKRVVWWDGDDLSKAPPA